MSSINPTLQLWRLIQSHRVTAVIYVATKLGIPELLRDGLLSVNELAKATGADKQALDRLLVAASTIGICAAAGENRYSLTELGAGLDGTAEQSLRPGQSSRARCCIIGGMAYWIQS
jgi:DNA-binding IclR family transcriptional regulator